MGLFQLNPTRQAEKELADCRAYLFKAGQSKAWAEAMLEFNSKRIKELEVYLGTAKVLAKQEVLKC